MKITRIAIIALLLLSSANCLSAEELSEEQSEHKDKWLFFSLGGGYSWSDLEIRDYVGVGHDIRNWCWRGSVEFYLINKSDAVGFGVLTQYSPYSTAIEGGELEYSTLYIAPCIRGGQTSADGLNYFVFAYGPHRSEVSTTLHGVGVSRTEKKSRAYLVGMGGCMGLLSMGFDFTYCNSSVIDDKIERTYMVVMTLNAPLAIDVRRKK